METSSTTDAPGFNAKDLYRDDPISGLAARELLEAARLSLSLKQPFFASVAYNMPFIENNKIPTTAVDAKGNLYYNTKWVNSFSLEDATFELAHEVMHIVQRLWERRNEQSQHGIWNLAADYLADTSLVDAGLSQSRVSKEMVTEEVMGWVHGEYDTVEAMYKKLLEEQEEKQKDCEACKEDREKLEGGGELKGEGEGGEVADAGDDAGEGEGGEEGDDGDDAGEGEGDDSGHGHKEHTCGNPRQCCAGVSADSSELSPEEEQKWTEIVVNAKDLAIEKGNMPGSIGEQVESLTKSRVRWEDHIIAVGSKLFGRDRYTYSRPNRRGPALRMRLPGHKPDGKTAIGAIDTSGSMSSEAVRECVSEYQAIMKLVGCSKLWLILHDVNVYFSGWVQEADLTQLKMSRGGTSHRGVFEVLNRTHDNPEFNLPKEENAQLLVAFTDLGTDFCEEPPDYTVVWAVPEGSYPGIDCPVPFGKKIQIPRHDG